MKFQGTKIERELIENLSEEYKKNSLHYCADKGKDMGWLDWLHEAVVEILEKSSYQEITSGLLLLRAMSRRHDYVRRHHAEHFGCMGVLEVAEEKQNHHIDFDDFLALFLSNLSNSLSSTLECLVQNEFCYQGAAADLGITVEALRKRMQRIREQLKSAFKDTEYVQRSA